jgi:hypothetical protein
MQGWRVRKVCLAAIGSFASLFFQIRHQKYNPMLSRTPDPAAIEHGRRGRYRRNQCQGILTFVT